MHRRNLLVVLALLIGISHPGIAYTQEGDDPPPGIWLPLVSSAAQEEQGGGQGQHGADQVQLDDGQEQPDDASSSHGVWLPLVRAQGQQDDGVETPTDPDTNPVANDDGPLSTDEDTALSNIDVLGNDSDADGDMLTVTSASAVHGTVTINADGTLNYTPTANYNGADTITYSISDGNGGTASATVSINVAAVNDAPVANDDGPLSTDEDTTLSNIEVLGNDSDADGDELSIVSFTYADFGTVSVPGDVALGYTPDGVYILGGGAITFGDGSSFPITDTRVISLTYTPNANFNGADSFTYTIDDGSGQTATATVHVTVEPVNDAPAAVDDFLTTEEALPGVVSVLANDSDEEGDPLTIIAFAQGSGGSVSDNDDGTLTYTPNANFIGSDTFTYTIEDGNGGTATGTVHVTVNRANGAPVAVDDFATMLPADGDSIVVSVLDNDSDPNDDELTITAVDGTTANGGRVEIVGSAGDRVNLAMAGTASQSSTAQADTSPGRYDASKAIDGKTSGADPVTDISATEKEYTPWWQVQLLEKRDLAQINLFNRTDAHFEIFLKNFRVSVFDGETEVFGQDYFQTGHVPESGFSIELPPGIAGDRVKIQMNKEQSRRSLYLAEVQVLSREVQKIKYSAAEGYTGVDTFTYTISNRAGYTDTATVSVDTSIRHQPPPPGTVILIVDEDHSGRVDVFAGRPGSGSLLLDSFTQGRNGEVTDGGNGILIYTPRAHFNGNDSFTYTVADSNGELSTTTVSVRVRPVNDVPAATGDRVIMNPHDTATVTVPVLDNDSDIELDPLVVASHTQAGHGQVTNVGHGVFTYQPESGFMGYDSFDYTVSDGNGGAATATVVVEVNPEYVKPTANGGSHHDIIGLVPLYDATFVSARSGNWSEPATWEGGLVPAEGARVRINAGHTVTFDTFQQDPIEWVRVDGTLEFDNSQDTQMFVETLVVNHMGVLRIGTADNPIGSDDPATAVDESDFSARILIADAGEGFDHQEDIHEIGRGLLAMGRVEMYGAHVTPYAKLAQQALAGDTQFVFDDAPENWDVGDRLIVTGNGITADEIVVVTGITQNHAGQTIVSFDRDVNTAGIQGLRSSHTTPEGYGLGHYVANMERNIVIASENPDIIDRRGHVMFMHNQDVHIENAGFYELGRTDKGRYLDDVSTDADGNLVPGTNVRARYPLHFHEAGVSTDATPGHVEGSVVWGSPGWGYVNHESYVNMVDNVAYNVKGAAFVQEFGNERGTFTRNLAIRTYGGAKNAITQIPYRQPLYDWGFAGHGFWTHSASVSMIDNIAAGSGESGFAYWGKGKKVAGGALTNFTGNTSFGSKFAMLQWRYQNPLMVFDDFTAWATGSVMWTTNARNVEMNNSLFIGNPDSPKGKVIGDAYGGGLSIERLVLDNTTIVGWESIRAPYPLKTFIVQDGYYANGESFEINLAGRAEMVQITGVEFAERKPSNLSIIGFDMDLDTFYAESEPTTLQYADWNIVLSEINGERSLFISRDAGETAP